MSRAALWRQEGNALEREKHAEEIFAAACEEGRRKSGTLPIWGDDSTFHFNPVLLQNCIQSPYFQKCCNNLKDWNSVIDEIYYEVKSLLVFQVGKQPSTAFCLLLRLLTLRITSNQLISTLKHPDSPYIRAIGFLYLRFVGVPDQIYGWIEPYLQDNDEFTIERAEQRDAKTITIGKFIRQLFQSRDYYGQTTLPRLPVSIERDLHVKLLAAEKIHERAVKHFKNYDFMKVFQTVGSKVMALYGDEDNPATWYRAEIDRVITHDDNGTMKYPKFVVTFTEYGNTETVTLGELDVIGGSESSLNNNWNPQGKNHDAELYEQVLRREKEQVTSSGRGSWSRRPPTTKESLSSDQYNRKSHSGFDKKFNRRDEKDCNQSRRNESCQYAPKFQSDSIVKQSEQNETKKCQTNDAIKKRSSDEIAAIAEKKRKLMAKYG